MNVNVHSTLVTIAGQSARLDVRDFSGQNGPDELLRETVQPGAIILVYDVTNPKTGWT
jgi:hypothetical protein